MRKMPSITCVLVTLLCAQLALAQQNRPVKNHDESEAINATVKGDKKFASSSSESVNDPRDTTQIFPARGGNVDWGLALSGGGVRSAAFSIGAMKALYDKGILDKVDVISSVSGGGYALYWLFTQYDPSENKDDFGETAFKNANYVKNVCELQNFARSNAIPNKYLLKLILNTKKGGAFADYKKAIESSFGNGTSPATTLDAYLKRMDEDRVPYFIINTTLKPSGKDPNSSTLNEKEKKIKNKLDSVFELTPEFWGNPSIGFHDWTIGDTNNPTLSESIAMSGAPKWRLERSIENPKPDVVKGKKLRLSDGGHSENLAALALIRRGIKNVIIIDAEQDPTYRFEAYRNLQKMLKQGQTKIDFSVPDIDKFLGNPKATCFLYELKNGKRKKVCSPPAVSIGKAVRNGANPVESVIHYVKMSQPESIHSERFSSAEAFETGYILSAKRLQDRCKKGLGDKTDICSCDNIKPDLIKEDKDYADLYTYEVKYYSDFLNAPPKSETKLWVKVKFFNTVGKVFPFFSYRFPHTTTADQSFYSDQLEAFVGLGYLQTTELKTKVDKQLE